MYNLDFIKFKNFCSLKHTVKKKGQPQNERKYLQYIYLTKFLYPEYIYLSIHTLE